MNQYRQARSTEYPVAILINPTVRQLRLFGHAVEQSGHRIVVLPTVTELLARSEDLHTDLLLCNQDVGLTAILTSYHALTPRPRLVLLDGDQALPQDGFAVSERIRCDADRLHHLLIGAKLETTSERSPEPLEGQPGAAMPEAITSDVVEADGTQSADDVAASMAGTSPDVAPGVWNSAIADDQTDQEQSFTASEPTAPYQELLPPPTDSDVQTLSAHLPEADLFDPSYQTISASRRRLPVLPIVAVALLLVLLVVVVGFLMNRSPEITATPTDAVSGAAAATDSAIEPTLTQESAAQASVAPVSSPAVTAISTAENTTSESEPTATAQRIDQTQTAAAAVVELPDLVVEVIDVVTSSSNAGNVINIRIRVRNLSDSDITIPFWIDLYAAPRARPVVNQPWDVISSYGATWMVDGLPARESITLDSLDADPARSNLLRFEQAETLQLYALVDSYGSADAGAVAEGNEENNLSEPFILVVEESPRS